MGKITDMSAHLKKQKEEAKRPNSTKALGNNVSWFTALLGRDKFLRQVLMHQMRRLCGSRKRKEHFSCAKADVLIMPNHTKS